MRESHQRHLRRFATTLFAVAIIYPLLVLPENALKSFLYPGVTIIFPNYELIHLFPRLTLLLAIVLLGWRAIYMRSFFSGLALIHLFLVTTSVFNAQDPDGWMFSLFGPQRRLDGLVYQTLIVLFALSCYGLFLKFFKARIYFLWAYVISATVQALILISQRVGFDFVGPPLFGGTYDRVSGTLSHPGMAAGFLVPALFIGLALCLRTEARKGVLLSLLLIIGIGLGATGNRAALVALLPVLVWVVASQRSLSAFALAAALTVCLFVGNYSLPSFSPQEETSVAAVEYGNTYTLQSRLAIWRLALEALGTIRGAPIIGGGPDAFRLALLQDVPLEAVMRVNAIEHAWPKNAKIASIEEVRPYEGLRAVHYDVTFETFGDEVDVVKAYPSTLDKTHNLFLDKLLAYGVVDVLVWLLLLLYPVGRLLFSKDMVERGLAWTLAALFIYYQAWFPVLQVEPLHLALVALAWVCAHDAGQRAKAAV